MTTHQISKTSRKFSRDLITGSTSASSYFEVQIPIDRAGAIFSPVQGCIGYIISSGTEYTNLFTLESSLEDSLLTDLSMRLSESALAEDWDKEDDERWSSFLK